MKIVHLSTHDIQGGAARAAFRLHQGLCSLGQDSNMFVSGRTSDDPKVIGYKPPMNTMLRIQRRFRREGINRRLDKYQKTIVNGYDGFCEDRSQHRQELIDQIPGHDILHLHAVNGFLDYTSFFTSQLAHSPLIWTMHDMNPFTGGCYYDQGCGRFQGQCGRCPVLGQEDAQDLSNLVWQRKQRIFRCLSSTRLHLVTASQWMADEVQKSTLFRNWPVDVIPCGLDSRLFTPYNRARARERLNIPHHVRVILFISQYVNHKRKGMNQLIDVLRLLPSEPEVYLLSAGYDAPVIPDRLMHRHLGFVSREDELAQVYSAADVFVIPSIQEAFGQTVLEAMACGTPVVGFETGGIPDMVRSGETGLLVPPGDIQALKEAVVGLLDDPEKRATMGRRSRERVEAEFTLERQAHRYLTLYQSILPESETAHHKGQ